jgi:putative pyoverdin transport system ATP-binding/permease protein
MKIRGLLGFLLRNSRGIVVPMVCAGVLAGLFSAGVIAVVSRTLIRHNASYLLALAFGALVVGRIVTTAAAQLLLVRFSQGTILDLSLTLCAKILHAPLRVLERRGSAQIIAVLTEDVSSVTWAVQSLPQLVMNSAILLCCGVYLAWLSWRMFVGAAVVTLVGAIIHKLLHDRAFKEIRAAREARSLLFGHFRSLTTGIKELMMHRGRREALLESEIRPAADAYRTSNLIATRQYALADAWMQALYYGLIGLLLFAFPRIAKPTPEALTGYAFALLYMMNPLWGVIGGLPAVARGNVALEKIEELGVSIHTEAPASVTPADPSGSPAIALEMRGVRFSYDEDAAAESFSLGPIDFSLRSGELVFVVGGNGSGKSTFVKVLTGLYAPQEGELCIDGQRVRSAEQAAYREHFAVVFSDCFLFEKLLGLESPNLQTAAHHYLSLLQMDKKVSLLGSALSTTDLSQGQRKRLGLVTAYLEDRPIYVFDEWAADQDPEYKEVFYTKLLPDLRNRGKAVVVITHDDRYFHIGDRVVKLEDGRMSVASRRAAKANLTTSAAT